MSRPAAARLRRTCSVVLVALATISVLLSPGSVARADQDGAADPLARVALLGGPETAAFGDLFDQLNVATDRLGLDQLEQRELAGYDAVLVTAPGYPQPTELTPAAEQRLDAYLSAGGRAYVEFARTGSDLLPRADGPPTSAGPERIVVTAESRAESEQEPLTVLEEHGSTYLPTPGPAGARTDLVYAHVAGVYDAVYGLPEETQPALLRLEHGAGQLAYATTALSNFDRGNYTLRSVWTSIIRDLLVSLLPTAAADTIADRALTLTSRTSPREWADPDDPVKLIISSEPNAPVSAHLDGKPVELTETEPGQFESAPLTLAEGAHRYRVTAGEGQWRQREEVDLEVTPREQKYRSMVDRTMSWYQKSGMCYYRSNCEGGVAEGLVSQLEADGSHRFKERIRGDSFVQTAYAFDLYGDLTGKKNYHATADDLMQLSLDRMLLREDNYLYGSWSTRGYDTGEHGDLGWLYPDDQGWFSLMSLLWSTKDDKTSTLEDGLRGTEALVRTANKDTGLYPVKRPSAEDLLERGWQGTAAIEDQDGIALDPHWQSQPQAAMLYAYGLTQDEKYLDAARKGLDRMVAAYPEVGIETSRTAASARYLLPLTAAYKYTGDDEYKETMLEIADYLSDQQDPETGAIPEIDGRHPASNADYGTGESSIVQENGDTVTDQLYSLGLLSMNLQLAFETTQEPTFRALQEKVLDYLARIQIESADEALDGTWMRGFDYRHWEYYGSSADTGWGPYAVQVGWTNAPIAIAALLYLSNEDFYPDAETDRTEISAGVQAEFDTIEAGGKVGASTAPGSEPAKPQHDPRDDLVGSWDFDEDSGHRVQDDSGYGNHGVLIGGERTQGVSGGAISLDGATDSVYLTNQAGRALDGAPGLTYAAWVKLGEPKAGWQRLWMSRILNRRGGLDVSVDNSGGDPRLAVGTRTEYPGSSTKNSVFGASSLTPGEWHHVAITADFAGNDLRAYVDGYPLAQTSTNGTLTVPTYQWGDPAVSDTFGRTPGGNEWYAGELDSVRLLRQPLSRQEVNRLMVLTDDR